MDLHPSDEQEALRVASAEWLADHMPLTGARARRRGHWRAMAEMGWFGVAAEEARGGLGLDHATEALVFAELGRFLAPVAALSTAVAAKCADGDMASTFAAGGAKAALGVRNTRGDVRILDGAEATHVLAVSGETTTLHRAPPMHLETGLDPSQQQAQVEAGALGAELPLSDRGAAFSHLQLLSAAYALGAADAARDMGAAYASMREQFGRPIGSFQGIKHPCADMAVRGYSARAQLLFAACALDAADDDARFHLAAAKRLCDQAALDNARTNIQVHGGVGMTDEAAPHLVLKRAHLLRFVAPHDPNALLA